jgi:hypothetical protein
MHQADTSAFTTDPKSVLDNVNINNNLLQALQSDAKSGKLKDFYQVGLWSYCEGDKDDKTGVETITFCSKSSSKFWFDPFAVWQLSDTNLQKIAGDKMQKGLDTYKKVSGWMVWSFSIALILSAVEFVVGFFAIFSRWGSLITTVVSTVSFPPLSLFTSSSRLHLLICLSTGSNGLHLRRRHHRYIRLRSPRWRLRDCAQGVPHQGHAGQANAFCCLARRCIWHGFGSLLAVQRLLLQRQVCAQEGQRREDTVHIRACCESRIPCARTAHGLCWRCGTCTDRHRIRAI